MQIEGVAVEANKESTDFVKDSQALIFEDEREYRAAIFFSFFYLLRVFEPMRKNEGRDGSNWNKKGTAFLFDNYPGPTK